MSIKYRSGYRYQLAESYAVKTSIRPPTQIKTQFITMAMDGTLTILAGYAWDGPSGAIATSSFMRPSLVHDALYQLLRQQLLPAHNRVLADELLRSMCIEDGMWKIRAWWVWRAVTRLAASAASPQSLKEIRSAP